jgi:hypothetical protein
VFVHFEFDAASTHSGTSPLSWVCDTRVLGWWRRQPCAISLCRRSPDGILFLKGVAVSSFRIVRIPRVWDDPVRRRVEKGIGEELAQLAGRFRDAIDEWNKSVADLARWIRYSPPPPGTKPAEPWFEDEEPGTIH